MIIRWVQLQQVLYRQPNRSERISRCYPSALNSLDIHREGLLIKMSVHQWNKRESSMMFCFFTHSDKIQNVLTKLYIALNKYICLFCICWEGSIQKEANILVLHYIIIEFYFLKSNFYCLARHTVINVYISKIQWL